MSEHILAKIRDLQVLIEDGTYITSENHLQAIHATAWSIQLIAEKRLRELEAK